MHGPESARPVCGHRVRVLGELAAVLSHDHDHHTHNDVHIDQHVHINQHVHIDQHVHLDIDQHVNQHINVHEHQHIDQHVHKHVHQHVDEHTVAVQHGEPRTSTLRSLLPHVTPDARPLLQALIDEVNTLLHRVRRVSRHNHTLLSRAVEIHQDVLQQLRPSAFVKTYSPAGAVSLCAGQATSLSVAG